MVIVEMVFAWQECVFATQDGGEAFVNFVDLGKFSVASIRKFSFTTLRKLM